jgi:pimeloyl-ACP methyl ester carboxylesterase/DNA-binding winged helix-turn-helix (wHTH) protein
VQFVFDNQLLDVERRELRRGNEAVAVEPQVFDLLVFLLKNRGRVVSKDDLIATIWGGRIVSDSTLDSRINAVRKAVGDSGKQQRMIRTIARKGVRFVGEVRERLESGTAGLGASLPPVALPDLRQEIQFCQTPEGVRLAYAEVGEGPVLVKAANWLVHLEYDWQSPLWAGLFRALAAEHRLVRYDDRGTGLSDRDVADISFEAFVRDLESVVDAAGLDRFALFGASRGCAVSIAYAVRHPERVSRLVLYGGYSRGRNRLGSGAETVQADALLTLFHQGFAPENRMVRQMLKYGQFPGSTPDQLQWFNDLQQAITSPENAVRIRRATFDIDVGALLPQVSAPTLVLHCLDDPAVPFDEGRRIAAGIPGARFVALESRNHLILESEPAWGRFLEEVTAFLKT